MATTLYDTGSCQLISLGKLRCRSFTAPANKKIDVAEPIQQPTTPDTKYPWYPYDYFTKGALERRVPPGTVVPIRLHLRGAHERVLNARTQQHEGAHLILLWVLIKVGHVQRVSQRRHPWRRQRTVLQQNERVRYSTARLPYRSTHQKCRKVEFRKERVRLDVHLRTPHNDDHPTRHLRPPTRHTHRAVLQAPNALRQLLS